VVKKRKRMTEDVFGEDCPSALTRFEEFESHVLPALMSISKEYRDGRFEELLQMEEDFHSGISATTGLVYVAVSKAIRFPKIGATRRSDPALRLKELSRSVPSPFEWVYYVRTPTPFKLEAEIHSHFDAHRIRERSACTEFFDVEVGCIGDFLKLRFETVVERMDA
jgi:hypothetical protein